MDFCADLANIQSILNYANEYVKPLSKIRHRGGNYKRIFEKILRIMSDNNDFVGR